MDATTGAHLSLTPALITRQIAVSPLKALVINRDRGAPFTRTSRQTLQAETAHWRQNDPDLRAKTR